jgi:FlaA1/EpsC-like NDP-sugar epimerase
MQIADLLKGRSVAVIGGTGSFGRTIVPELLNYQAKEVIVFSRDEEKQLDMQRAISDPRLRFVIGDVRDIDRVSECIKSDYVYHAAALKIMPTCEQFPLETLKTNIQGTLNVKEACAKNGVEKAIFVSTDKAVKPVNTYGMTKALAEKIWLDPKPSSKTLFSVVRYGNVLGSRGSVVPYFRDLVEQRKPLPITDPTMSRFLLTLRQAIELVFYATANTHGGEIFIPKNPACMVLDLVEALAGKNYPIENVGIRPGEKTVEVLLNEEETRRTEERETCFVVHPYGGYHGNMKEEFTSINTRQLEVQEIRQLLKEAGIQCSS